MSTDDVDHKSIQRSGEDRRKADRRVADIPVDEDRRKGPIRSGTERRKGAPGDESGSE